MPVRKQDRIVRFQGEYAFLSNFYPCAIAAPSGTYTSAEHAYQAAKTVREVDRQWIRAAPTPGKAKRRGRKVEMRPDWDQVKIREMYRILQCKFCRDPLRQQLIDTAPRELVEGNTWGDYFWGEVNGKGENHLGKLLMRLRDEFSIDNRNTR